MPCGTSVSVTKYAASLVKTNTIELVDQKGKEAYRTMEKVLNCEQHGVTGEKGIENVFSEELNQMRVPTIRKHRSKDEFKVNIAFF